MDISIEIHIYLIIFSVILDEWHFDICSQGRRYACESSESL